MSYVDVGIPLLVGLLLTLRPGIFVKASGVVAHDAAKIAKLRKVGFVLLGVATLYLLLKFASG